MTTGSNEQGCHIAAGPTPAGQRRPGRQGLAGFADLTLDAVVNLHVEQVEKTQRITRRAFYQGCGKFHQRITGRERLLLQISGKELTDACCVGCWECPEAGLDEVIAGILAESLDAQPGSDRELEGFAFERDDGDMIALMVEIIADMLRARVDVESEIRQLLDILVHSLYKEQDIFLRELISNSSDACDKLRFEALGNDSLYDGDTSLRIRVNFDKDARTVTITDSGVGMTRDEVVENIGTIAKSGTNDFLEAMQQLNKETTLTPELIGQFGVGFYSSFLFSKSEWTPTLSTAPNSSQNFSYFSGAMFLSKSNSFFTRLRRMLRTK